MAVVVVAPCQCFSPGGNQTTSPRPDYLDRTSPAPREATAGRHDQRLSQRVRVPRGAGAGLGVTLAPATRAGSVVWNNGSSRTMPVNRYAGPLAEGCEPFA